MITYRKLGKLGRWGNQLFEVAGVSLYAKRFGYSFALPNWTGCNVLENTQPYTQGQWIASRFLPTRQLDDMRSYPWWKPTRLYPLTYLYDHPENNINFYGYFQDPLSLKLLQEHKTEIIKLYTFNNEIETAYKKLISPYEPYIALHLRRGDFVKLGYALPSVFYHDLLEKIHGDRSLYISSDDATINEELKGIRQFKLQNPLPHVPDFIFDFWMIKNATTVVGCGSTFSWWAAYLGNKNDYWSPPLTHLWSKHEKPPLAKITI